MTIEIQYVNIRNRLIELKEAIAFFNKELNSERKHFPAFDTAMVMKSDVVIAAINKEDIVGIIGMKKKFFFGKSYIIIKEGYQGLGLGKRLIKELLYHAKNKCSMLYGVIEKDNKRCIKLQNKFGTTNAGTRGDLEYFTIPLDNLGRILCFLIRISFPAIKLVDRIKR
ncbi:GNAT family N-acetyltransferase [uncultured Desulfosarcina sp.]|uniref:GNAT family N-acetyltransferase n=1 Tax=uncultured Desulfosarcina sp. TaxID=218289 RepID=UPI0029C8CCB4|nr:GNAT family N-acetyltransferase [uncultured Desulfosarcina sp.]